MAAESTPNDRLKAVLAGLVDRTNVNDTHLRAALLEAYLDGVTHTNLTYMAEIAWPKRDK